MYKTACVSPRHTFFAIVQVDPARLLCSTKITVYNYSDATQAQLQSPLSLETLKEQQAVKASTKTIAYSAHRAISETP